MKGLAFTTDWVGQPCVRCAEAVETTKSTPWRRYLLPTDEDDHGFMEETRELSVKGLRLISLIFIVVPLLWFVGLTTVRLAWPSEFIAPGLSLPILVLLGIGGWQLSRVEAVHRWARPLGIGLAQAAFVVILLDKFGLAFQSGLAPSTLTSGLLAIWVLIAVAVLPLRPIQTLGLGMSLMGIYVVFLLASGAFIQPDSHLLPSLMGEATILLVAVAMSAVSYRMRAASYRRRRETQVALDSLAQTQSDFVIAKNATSQMRLAAALSHELNTPIAALSSSLNTMLLAREKWRTRPEDNERFEVAFDDAARTASQATTRLKEIVDRTKRLTNLDRAEEQVVDMNAFLSDVVALSHEQILARAEVKLDLDPLPPISCRPQQMAFVLTNLLQNAASASKPKGRIHVRSFARESDAWIEVQDEGPGISAERLSRLFEPEFTVSGGRVEAGNWSLYMARGIVADHGGRLHIESTEGQGTTARMILPAGIAAGTMGESSDHRPTAH